ncbi:MAG TPA: hypothetical protein VFI54_11530 [Solirubrobacteraceae bacterium]|nr:hypothetical protein [Solirubrobacteraceae bacterium]
MSIPEDDRIARHKLTPAHPHAIDDRSVRRLQVLNDPFVITEDQTRVATGDARLVHHDIATVVAPDQEF